MRSMTFENELIRGIANAKQLIKNANLEEFCAALDVTVPVATYP